MRPLVIDSSVYIAALRRGEGGAVVARWSGPSAPVWLSAVVLEELYAGCSKEQARAVETLERDFTRLRRVLVPNQSDWSLTGRIVARIGARYGYEQTGRARLTNDTLIATSAARTGMLLLTLNERDFARISEFCSFHWELAAR